MFDFGILWNNARNLQLIKKFNPKKAIRLADNKYRTKKFLWDRWIPVPETYAFIKSRQELQQADFFNMPSQDYIVKPNKWSRWRGIYRVHIPQEEIEREESMFGRTWWSRQLKVGSQMLSEQERKTRMVDILEWQHSLWMSYDAAMVEELIIPWGWFEPFCEFWLADIRLIAHNLVPVAAMLRVPTAVSWGTANLDRWWLWIGINIATGIIESMSVNNKIYKNKFPPAYAHFRGKRISYREDILLYSSKIQYLTNMWYLALDRVITEDGPKLLEINARAWMKFQLACVLPLKSRLRKIQNLDIPTPEKWVEVCKSLFNPQKWSLIWKKDILYVSQTWELVLEHIGEKKNTFQYIDVVVDIDMQSSRNRLSEDLYALVQWDWIHQASVRFDHNKQVIKHIKRYPLKGEERAKIVLWRESVSKYYIKPIKKIFTKVDVIKQSMILPDEHDELHILDEKIHKLWRSLNLSRILKPTNFLEQLDLFIEYNGSYNPRFTYNRPTKKKMDSIKEEIDLLRKQYFPSQSGFQSKFARLFEEKIDEMEHKHSLIQAYKDQDFERISLYNERLYGPIFPNLVKQAKERIFDQESDDTLLWAYLTSGEVRARIRKMLREYNVKWAHIVYDAEMTAKMSIKRGDTITIKIPQWVRYRDLELQSTLDHEIWVHVVRWLAGKATGRHILSSGTAWFIVDEEGLASWKSREILPPEYVKLGMRKKYYLLDVSKDKNFTSIWSLIRGLWTTELRKIFMDVLRIKKWIENTSLSLPWWVYMKDKVYAEWYVKILNRIEAWWDPATFMVWKVKIEDMQYFKVK